MKANTIFVAAAIVMLAGAISGCGHDYYAQQLVMPNTQPGKVLQNIAGTGEQLVRLQRIDICRQVAAPDKTQIDVWAIKARGAKAANGARGTMVILHNLSESKAVFPYFGAAERLANLGYDAVLIDLRCHGRSGGKYITYGAKEKEDVKAVIDSLAGDRSVSGPIYVFGVGLGGATAIQYAAIDPRVKGVLAMAPYKDAQSICRRQLAVVAPTMSNEDFAATMKKAGSLADFDPDKASALVAVAKLSCPLLLVHGMIDLSVPLDHSQAIFDAAKEPKKLMIVTPMEAIPLGAILEDWIAEKMELIASGKLTEVQTQPAEGS